MRPMELLFWGEEIMACPCIIWIDNIAPHYILDPLWGAGTTRGGQRITVPNKRICKVAFYMCRTGSPTGTAYARIRRVSDDSIIETSGDTLDVATLPTCNTFALVEFTFDSVINEEVRIQVEFTGGSAGNRINLSLTQPAIIGVYTHYIVGYTDYAAYDTRIKIYESPVVLPTVVTNPASNCAADGLSVQLNGNVTATGGDNPTRGFRWGNAMGGPYPNTWTDAGTHGVGVYSHTIAILCDTTYYYTAVATNCRGTSYGAEQSFSCPCPAPPTPPEPEPEVEEQHIADALHDWEYDYVFKHKPAEKVRGIVTYSFGEAKKIRSPTIILFKETRNVLSRIGRRFQETNSINSVILIPFSESRKLIADLIKDFEETSPVIASIFSWILQRLEVFGETISTEEDILMMMRDLEKQWEREDQRWD